jgi:hypothetical protein
MQTAIPSDREPIVGTLAISAGLTTVEQYVLGLIEGDGERAAIQMGLEQAFRGEGCLISEFDAEFRKRNGIKTGE